jgi:hypothetical protein
MAHELGANMTDLKSDLEWLEPITAFNRNFSVRNAGDDGGATHEKYQESSTIVDGGVAGNIAALNLDDAHAQTLERTQETGSPPELDAGYHSSDSGLSIADDSMAEHLTPAQSMLQLLSTNVDGRFGSFYSVSNHSKLPGPLPEPQIREMDVAYAHPGMCPSRFSWASSIYSDDVNVAGDIDMWLKPIEPLVISKEAPPPLPERNPLRLLRRRSKDAPKAQSENIRASRNIHNLQLDLSRLRKEDERNSVRDSRPSRQRSHAPGSKKRAKQGSDELLSPFASTGHILDAMHNPTQHTDTSNKAREKKKARRSTKTSSTSATHSRSQSTKEVINGSTYTQQLMSARGHVRAASEPFRQTEPRSGNACKWDESMPFDEPIRRSCIASLTNEHRSRRPTPALAVNKQLPPLPVKSELA